MGTKPSDIINIVNSIKCNHILTMKDARKEVKNHKDIPKGMQESVAIMLYNKSMGGR